MTDIYVAQDGPFAGCVVGPGPVADREPETIPLDQRREADCVNLLRRSRVVLDHIAAGRMGANDALDMAQYIEDAIGNNTTDQRPAEHLQHRCLHCDEYFDHQPRPGVTHRRID